MGFMRASSAAPTSPRVPGVSGRFIETKSSRSMSSCSPTARPPPAAIAPASTNGSWTSGSRNRKPASMGTSVRPIPPKPDDAERAVAPLAAQEGRAVVPAALAHEPVLGQHVVRQRQHPGDRGLGQRVVHRPRGDQRQHVGRRAGRHVAGVVADAEAARGAQAVVAGERGPCHPRRHRDHAVRGAQLVGRDLRLVAIEAAHRHARMGGERAEPSVAGARPAVGGLEVGGQHDPERPAGRRAHGDALQGLPSAVRQRSSTTIRSGSGPA